MRTKKPQKGVRTLIEIDFSKVGHETPAPAGKGKRKPKDPDKGTDMVVLEPIPVPVEKFKAFYPQAQELRTRAMAVTVDSKDEDKAATDFAKEIRTAIKEIKDLEKYYTERHKEFNEQVRNISKAGYKPLEEGLGYLRNTQLAFKKKVELAKREQEKLITDAAKKLEADLKEKAKELGVDAPKVGPVKFPKGDKTTRGEKGRSYVTGSWTYEVLDITLVPRDHLKQEVAPKSVTDKIAMGVRDKIDEETGEVLQHAIPGIRIYFDETVAYR
jgi:hypothetical protein